MPKKGAVVLCGYLGRPKDSLESHMAKGMKINKGWLFVGYHEGACTVFNIIYSPYIYMILYIYIHI